MFSPEGERNRSVTTLLALGQQEEMFSAVGNVLWLQCLSRIKRFSSESEIVHRTDVWTHARRTAYLGTLLGTIVAREEHLGIDLNKIFRMGYHHGDPEIITGDIPTPLKQTMSPEQMQILRANEDGAMKLLAMLFGHNNPDKFLSEYLEMAEKESLEAQIVNIADKLDGLGETINEIRCGNPAFLKVLSDYREVFRTFRRYPVWQPLKKHPSVQLKSFPTQDQANSIPKIKPEDLRDKSTAWERFLEGEMPQFYRTWLTLSINVFDRRTEKFLLPGWYLELWNYWGPPRGTTSASGLYIP